MIDKVNALPKPLKVVCWLQLSLVAISAVLTVASITISTGSDAFSNILSIILSVLVVLGILQASKYIRMLVLILTCVGTFFYGFAMVVLLATLNPGGIVMVIPFGIGCLTIWGLNHKEARNYFGI